MIAALGLRGFVINWLPMVFRRCSQVSHLSRTRHLNSSY